MKEVFGGIVSALIAYIFNRILIKRQKKKSIVYVIPLIEELSKTILGVIISGNIIAVHFVFGIIEAIYDWFHTEEKRIAYIAIAFSIISHSIFGFISYYIYLWTGWIGLGIIVATLIHIIWNYYITRGD